VGGLDAGGIKELPNKLAALSAVIIQCPGRVTM
jgi:hypothetical protein